MYDTNNSDVLEVSAGYARRRVRKIAPTGAGAPQPIFAVTSDASCSIWSLPNPEEAPVILYEDEDAFGCALNSVGSQFVIGSVDGRRHHRHGDPSLRATSRLQNGWSRQSDEEKRRRLLLSQRRFTLMGRNLVGFTSPRRRPVRCFDRFSDIAGRRVSIPTATKSSSVARSGTFAPLASFAPFHPSTAPRSSSTPPAPSPWRTFSTLVIARRGRPSSAVTIRASTHFCGGRHRLL